MLWRTVERLPGPLQIIRMVVAVVLEQRLERHAEIFRGLPWIDPELHKPCCSRMSQSMRRDTGQACSRGDVAKGFVAVFHRFSVPFHTKARAKPFPAA